MAAKIQIKRSDSPAQAPWPKDALLSNSEDGFIIHPATLARDEAGDHIQKAARRIAASGIRSVVLSGGNWDLESQWRFFLGFWSAQAGAAIDYAPLGARDRHELDARIEANEWVRQQVNASAEQLGPMQLAEAAAGFIKALAPEAVSFEIKTGQALADEGYAGLYGVGRGSDRPAVLLTLDFNPRGVADAPVAAVLVGKGITFDSGGYSIKSTEGMLTMKIDMGGAATVTGALALAIRQGLDQRVRLILCCAENLISGHAYKLGDILVYRNGVRVDVANTDAEGRLVLADGLIDASTTQASLIIDAATLTGAALVAVGARYNAVFSLDPALSSRFLNQAQNTGELHWPLPLRPWHQDACPSAFADTLNSRPVKGGGAGGASNAAGFLSRFIEPASRGWLHLDLAGVSMDQETALWAAGATGHGLRTIAAMLLAEPG